MPGLRFGRFLSGKPVGSQELEFYTRQIAALIRAGVPLDQTLSAVADQGSRPLVNKIFLQVRERLREGDSFATALKTSPTVFSESFRGMVEAGESSGNLPLVLERLADSLEAQNQLKSSLLQALAYPLIVLFVVVLIIGLLMGYVVPQVVSVLANQGQDLPALTRALIAITSFLSTYGFALLGGTLLLVICTLAAWRRFEGFKHWLLARFFKLPFIGRILQLSECVRFTEGLSVMLLGGLPVTAALALCARSAMTSLWSKQLFLVREWVIEGVSLGRALTQVGHVPSLLIQLTHTGEKTGQLPELLKVAAREFNREIKLRTSLMATVLEPALILGLGGVVLSIVLAVMMPLIEMNAVMR